MLPEHMTHVLAEKTLDAFPELLHPVNVGLSHSPGTIGSIRRPGFELLDPLLDPVVDGNVCHEILDNGEGLHRPDRNRFSLRHISHPGHAHQLWMSIDLCRT